MKLAPLIVTLAVEGKPLTEVGVMLQPDAPNATSQLNATVPLNPSSAAIEIAPVAPALPALISGKGVGSVRMKS
ncbi:MAG: hypothetical protein ACRD3B_17205 [Candidatus Sulfotelmatobacter sp.]